jgi:hypothetical protein
VSYPTFKTHFKNGDPYQVMTQAIGQEPLLTTLDPLPAGSRIIGGQEKHQRHLGQGNLWQPQRLHCFQSAAVVPKPSHIPRNIPLPLTKTCNTYSLGYCSFLLDHKSKGTTLRHMHSIIFELCAVSHRTTPTGRHRRGWDEEREKEGREK